VTYIFCTKCGCLSGQQVECTWSYGHRWRSVDEYLFCKTCGITPGKQSECTSTYGHSWTAVDETETFFLSEEEIAAAEQRREAKRAAEQAHEEWRNQMTMTIVRAGFVFILGLVIFGAVAIGVVVFMVTHRK
jgi:hypothetical protein